MLVLAAFAAFFYFVLWSFDASEELQNKQNYIAGMVFVLTGIGLGVHVLLYAFITLEQQARVREKPTR